MRAIQPDLGDFLTAFPTYKKTKALDALRKRDFKRLEKGKQVYLDYTGGSIYGASQVKKHLSLLQKYVLGNPHSNHPTSLMSTKLVSEARSSVFTYFNASPDEYCVIFTANASNALKLVGESYPFEKSSQFLLTLDNHNSVNGIREFAKARHADVLTLESEPENMRITQDSLRKLLKAKPKSKSSLFAYPAQSNFTGVQHPLEWIALAQKYHWDVLLDAAAFVPTNKLDLSIWKPDFVTISFYKMFGYPTGVGCLIVRKKALSKLVRPWFAGGTIWAASASVDGYVSALEEAAFEDGTLNYLTIPAVKIGLDMLSDIGIQTIHDRVQILIDWLLQKMQQMTHKNGAPLFSLYGPKDTNSRGGTIAFNFLDMEGHIVDERIVEEYAAKKNISLRTGCFCNPGSGEIIFHLEKQKLAKIYKTKKPETYDYYLKLLGLESGGAIRLSLGIVSNFEDIQKFLAFAQTFKDSSKSKTNLRPRDHC